MNGTTLPSLKRFHATSTARRADELVRAFFEAVHADERRRSVRGEATCGVRRSGEG
jgi:hypothetical protein